MKILIRECSSHPSVTTRWVVVATYPLAWARVQKMAIKGGARGEAKRTRWVEWVTIGGEGRVIPLNGEAMRSLIEWPARFGDPEPEHFGFPT
jgi:hypothetical protein